MKDYSDMEPITLEPAENGGWVIMGGAREGRLISGRMPMPIAAFSNDSEMIEGLRDLVALRRLAMRESMDPHQDTGSRTDFGS